MAQDRILPSTSKKSNKNIAFFYFVTSFWLFFFEGWCKWTFKKYWDKKLFFCWNLVSHWQKSRIQIRIRIWIQKSVVRIRGSGSVPKCHGFTTMLPTLAAVTQNNAWESRVNTLVNPCRISGYGAIPLYTLFNTQFLINSKMFNPIILSLAIHKPSPHSLRVQFSLAWLCSSWCGRWKLYTIPAVLECGQWRPPSHQTLGTFFPVFPGGAESRVKGECYVWGGR